MWYRYRIYRGGEFMGYINMAVTSADAIAKFIRLHAPLNYSYEEYHLWQPQVFDAVQET